MQIYQLILIFACSLLCGNTGILHECRVTLSDALPIQFWSTNCDTFNEKEVPGIFSKCFCQPFNSGDEMVLQVKDTTGKSIKLNILSSAGDLLEQKSFTESGSSGYYYLFFSLDDYEGQEISFAIIDTSFVTYLNSTSVSYSGWSNITSEERQWLIAPYELYSKELRSSTLSTPVPNGTDIEVRINASSAALKDVEAYLYNNAGTLIHTLSFGDMTTGVYTESVTTSAEIHKIGIRAAADSTTQSGAITSVEIVAPGSTVFNITDFSTGWTSYDPGTGAATWTLSSDASAVISTVFPQNQSDSLRKTPDLSPDIDPGVAVSGSIVYNVPTSKRVLILVYLANITESGDPIDTIDVIGDGLDHTWNYSGTSTLNDSIYFDIVVAQVSGATNTVIIRSVSFAKDVNYTITNGDFSSGLTGWTQEGVGYSWTNPATFALLTIPAPEFAVDFLTSPETSSTIEKVISIPSGVPITYQFQAQASTEDSDPLEVEFTIELRNSLDQVVYTTTHSVVDESLNTFTGAITTDDAVANVTIVASNTGTAEVVSFNVSSFLISMFQEVAKSDCISVKEDHDETVLITYSNNRPFASLNSSVGTPDHAFNLRIPAVFFKERFPEESEVIGLSNSRSIQLNAQVKAQRLLNVGPMPFYMHRKAKLALSFQTVTIDDQDWVKEEAYEVSETKRTHPLSKAQCWLTEKDTIYRNVL